MNAKRGTFHNTSAEAQTAAARRGGKKVAQAKYLVEGEYVNAIQIAERLGVHTTTARERLKAAQKMPGPVTWERLGAT